MNPRRAIAVLVLVACGTALIAAAAPEPDARTDATAPRASPRAQQPADDGLLAFTQTPRRPGNLLARIDVVGRSSEGRPIWLRQVGDPAIEREVLVFGCIHGDECAARR